MNQIYISVGSNIDRVKHTCAGLDAMQASFGELRLSSVYESEAVGFDGSPFYNLVVAAKTNMGIADTVATLKGIERDNGRVSTEKKFAPRTLDLDLLLFNSVVTQTPIELPRAEILYNAFVLLPLAELAPHLVHPITGKKVQLLWEEFDQSSQKLWKIAFDWKAS